MTRILIGKWGYGSIGIINDMTADAAYPDTDVFVLRAASAPAESNIIKVTVEALDGADFQPAATVYFNGASLLQAMSPLPGDPGVARREVLMVSRANCESW